MNGAIALFLCSRRRISITHRNEHTKQPVAIPGKPIPG